MNEADPVEESIEGFPTEKAGIIPVSNADAVNYSKTDYWYFDQYTLDQF